MWLCSSIAPEVRWNVERMSSIARPVASPDLSEAIQASPLRRPKPFPSPGSAGSPPPQAFHSPVRRTAFRLHRRLLKAPARGRRGVTHESQCLPARQGPAGQTLQEPARRHDLRERTEYSPQIGRGPSEPAPPSHTPRSVLKAMLCVSSTALYRIHPAPPRRRPRSQAAETSPSRFQHRGH